MEFGEKLFQLRKEKGLSQEALAEQLKTSRQAVSKWENGQGYPEMEKLLCIGSSFNVSMDYLLKKESERGPEEEQGYYVSRELAEAHLTYVHSMGHSLAVSLSLFLLGLVPYFLFKGSPEILAVMIAGFAAAGVIFFIKAMTTKGAENYEIISSRELIFDPGFKTEITDRFESVRTRLVSFLMLGVVLAGMGFVTLLLEENDVTNGALSAYYPVITTLSAAGVFILTRVIAAFTAYDLLIHSEKHSQKRKEKSEKKLRKKWKEWI
ncbi:helix-turn-helix domain-containing protein [Halobacillus litoralis]|uniref:helix-turn-helix domain-containing protein n=1 Tax=Halobacillus litoralis TaxID=45668 RepID=UPI00136B51D4|nr:helix-turn-helix transcriptional regulator [Halobacillus litoralis]MYL37401.1 helix-turn-helix domain-containing protein [Halobacillus litoralis]